MPYFDPGGAIDFAIKTLEPWRMKVRAQDVACDAVVREGNPAQQIIAAARQFNVDRLLLGTRSRSKVGKLLLGSVAEQVLRSVNLPVITVGPEAHLEAAGDTEQRVSACHHIGETSRPSAALACQIAATQGAKLVLLHVLPPVDEMQRGWPAHRLGFIGTARVAHAGGGHPPTAVVPRWRLALPRQSRDRDSGSLGELTPGSLFSGCDTPSAFNNLTHDRTVYRVLPTPVVQC